MSYYKMERGWLDSEMFARAEYDDRGAWAWMVGEARWDDCLISSPSGTPVMVRRGQLYTSIRFMSEKFGWSKDRVARTLKRFERWGAIRVETATGQNLITICKYDDYQGSRDSTKDSTEDRVEDTPKDAPKDKQEEIQIPSKKENTLFGENPVQPPPVPDKWFDEKFWKTYPKQRAGSKYAASKAMTKALTKTTKEEIENAVQQYAQSDEVARGFAKGAAAWLNDERWTHQYQPAGKGYPRNQQKTGYLDKIQNAGARASQSLKDRMEAEGDNPWDDDCPLRLTQGKTALANGDT